MNIDKADKDILTLVTMVKDIKKLNNDYLADYNERMDKIVTLLNQIKLEHIHDNNFKFKDIF
ncbi:MAG: hypothetical protein AB7V16_12785 [Vulcanibacillus sp.]